MTNTDRKVVVEFVEDHTPAELAVIAQALVEHIKSEVIKDERRTEI